MIWNRSAMTAIAMLWCISAHAQHHGQSVHQGATPHHAAGGHPGMGQQHHSVHPADQMMHQWYMEQMMLNQMMSAPRGRRSHSQGSAGRPVASQPGQHAQAVPGECKDRNRQPCGRHECEEPCAGRQKACAQAGTFNAETTSKDRSKDVSEPRWVGPIDRLPLAHHAQPAREGRSRLPGSSHAGDGTHRRRGP